MKKELIFGIIILLLSTSIVPALSGNYAQSTTEKNSLSTPMPSSEKTTTRGVTSPTGKRIFGLRFYLSLSFESGSFSLKTLSFFLR